MINMVPLSVPAAILVFIGYKLCRPSVWRNVVRVGPEQFVVFSVTVLVTVTTDLLMGIVAGVILELLLNLWYVGLWHTLRYGSGYHVPRPGGPRPQRLLTE